MSSVWHAPEAVHRTGVTRWRWAASVALAAAVVGCGGGNDGVDAAPEVSPGSLLVPPGHAGDLTRSGLELVEVGPGGSGGVPVSAVRVERAAEGVVIALLLDRAELEDGRDGLFSSEGAGPRIGEGHAISGFSSMGASVMWPASDVLAIELASRDLSEEQLTDLARQVTLAADGSPVLPTAPIGAITGSLDRPAPAVAAGYDDGVSADVVVHAATTEVQDAYEALVMASPEDEESVRTAVSCCAEAISEPRRTVDVGGRDAVVGSISPYIRALIVDGDPGIVVVSLGSFDDADLVAIASAVEPATVEDVARLVERERGAEADRRVEAITASEQQLGYEVIHRWDDEGGSAVLTFGTDTRPEREASEAGGPTLCGTPANETSGATCLPATSPEMVVEAFGPVSDLSWGLVADGVEEVHYEFPEGQIATTITEVDVPSGVGPTRVFHVLATLDERVDLMADMSPEDFATVSLVATDDQGRELARRPVFPDSTDPA